MNADQDKNNGTLSFIVVEDDDGDDPREKGLFPRRDEVVVRVREISVAAIETNLRKTIAGLSHIFDQIDRDGARLPLRQAQVSFEVSANGGISLVGSSLQSGVKGAITLTFGA